MLLILNENLTKRGQSEDYFFWKLKLDLGRYHQSFCYQNNIYDNPSTGEKLSRYISAVNDLDVEGLKKFIRAILPHRKARFSSLEEYKDDNFHSDEIQDAFFEILQELRGSDKLDFGLIYWKMGRSSYAPTAIKDGERQCENICKRIVQNALDLDLYLNFEADKLITMDIETDNIFQTADHVLFRGGNDSNRITKSKKVALIKLNQAKGEINA